MEMPAKPGEIRSTRNDGFLKSSTGSDLPAAPTPTMATKRKGGGWCAMPHCSYFHKKGWRMFRFPREDARPSGVVTPPKQPVKSLKSARGKGNVWAHVVEQSEPQWIKISLPQVTQGNHALSGNGMTTTIGNVRVTMKDNAGKFIQGNNATIPI
ncbi:hypothetical protein ACOMHN_030095 [Nucella lapillus]